MKVIKYDEENRTRSLTFIKFNMITKKVCEHQLITQYKYSEFDKTEIF